MGAVLRLQALGIPAQLKEAMRSVCNHKGHIEAGLFWIGTPIYSGALLSLKIQHLCSRAIPARDSRGFDISKRER
jgi:hypothetical protein